jgi:hypothetical protein
VVPLSSTTAADCAQALLTGWIQRFGVPSIITSNPGPQFTSAVWAALCSLLNISRATTTAYHPQSNGIVERFHRRLKDALRARAAGADWMKHLPWVLLGIRTAWRDGSTFSPADAVYGSQPFLPGQYLDSPENPSPSFLADFQGVLAGRPPISTSHHSTPEPAAIPGPLRFGKKRRPPATPVAHLRRPLRRAGAQPLFLQGQNRKQDRQDFHSPVETLPHTVRRQDIASAATPSRPPAKDATADLAANLACSAPDLATSAASLTSRSTARPPNSPSRQETCHFPLPGCLAAAATFPPFWSSCTQHGAAIFIRNLTRYRLV